MSELKIKSNIAISDSGFIFVPSTGDSFSVNPIGAELLRQIKAMKTNDEIKKSILTTYQIDAASFEKDFYDFLKQLQQYNLLTSTGHEA